MIDLSDTDLTSIETQTFNDLDNLVELQLDNNELTEIKELTFEKLVKLKSLHLNNNQISFLRNHENHVQIDDAVEKEKINLSLIFKGLENLLNLFLHYNEITEIDSNVFNSNLNKLQVLYLNQNKISVIKENTFDNLVSLKKIRLDNNNIISIENFNVFSKLSNLELVNLQQNNFSNQNDQTKNLCTKTSNPKCKVLAKIPRKIKVSTKSTTPMLKTTLAPG